MLDSEISRAKRLVAKLETVRAERGNARHSMLVTKQRVRRRHTEAGHEPRAAIWAAMQSLMHSVDRIAQKQDKMEKVVKKVTAPPHPTIPLFTIFALIALSLVATCGLFLPEHEAA